MEVVFAIAALVLVRTYLREKRSPSWVFDFAYERRLFTSLGMMAATGWMSFQ